MLKVDKVTNKRNTADKILTYTAFLSVIILMLQLIIVDMGIMPHEKSRIMGIAVSGLGMLPALGILTKRNPALLILTLSGTMVIVLGSLIIFPANTEYIVTESFYLLFIVVPGFLCIASIEEVDAMKKALTNIANLISLMAFAYVLLILSGRISVLGYNMSFSNFLLLPALIFATEQKWSANLKFLLLLLFMLLFGSRGPLFIAFSFFIMVRFLFSRGSWIFLIILLIVATPIIFINLDGIMFFTESRLGFSPRSLNMLLGDNLLDATNRDLYYTTAIESIKDNPWLGHGIFGDRPLFNGHYSHNIFLEVLNNFGLFLGTIFLFSLASILITNYFNTVRANKKLLLTFFAYGFVPLLVSGSYLISIGFGIFLGGVFLFLRLSLSNRKNLVRVDID